MGRESDAQVKAEMGANPEQGITRGSTFLYAPLRIRIDFPSNWDVANSPQQVVAKAPDAEVFMLLQTVVKQRALVVMNHSAPGSQPQPGARIKIVVGG
jgi:predicted Zn-dependent protease